MFNIQYIYTVYSSPIWFRICNVGKLQPHCIDYYSILAPVPLSLPSSTIRPTSAFIFPTGAVAKSRPSFVVTSERLTGGVCMFLISLVQLQVKNRSVIPWCTSTISHEIHLYHVSTQHFSHSTASSLSTKSTKWRTWLVQWLFGTANQFLAGETALKLRIREKWRTPSFHFIQKCVHQIVFTKKKTCNYPIMIYIYIYFPIISLLAPSCRYIPINIAIIKWINYWISECQTGFIVAIVVGFIVSICFNHARILKHSKGSPFGNLAQLGKMVRF